MHLSEASRMGVALVFGLHVFISRVINGSILYPPVDIPMLDDTLLDMALGIAGGLSYAVMAWRLGALGAVAPMRAAPENQRSTS